MSETVVDQLYASFSEIVKYFDDRREVTLRSTADDNFRKSLIVAAASYFETRICDDILSVLETDSIENELLIELVRNKAFESRQYHTLFSWDAKNATTFFRLFGREFLSYMKEQVKADVQLDQAIRLFLEIGSLRNELAHENYAAFPLEKTAKEIYDSYRAALVFVEAVPKSLRTYIMDRQHVRQTGQIS